MRRRAMRQIGWSCATIAHFSQGYVIAPSGSEASRWRSPRKVSFKFLVGGLAFTAEALYSLRKLFTDPAIPTISLISLRKLVVVMKLSANRDKWNLDDSERVS